MEFTRMFSNTILEPRRSPRVKRAFDIRWSTDGGRTFRSAYPIDISLGGFGLVAKADIPADDLVVDLRLERKSVKARVQKVSSALGTLRGNLAWRMGMRFTSVDADDLALIDRFIQRVPLDTADVLRADLRLLASWPDAVERLLPKMLLARLLEELVKLQRLAPLDPHATPLVKYHYSGALVREKERLHGVKIKSRVVSDGRLMDYLTQVYFNESLSRIEAIPLDDGHLVTPPLAQPRNDWRRAFGLAS